MKKMLPHTGMNAIRPNQQVNDNAGTVFKVYDDFFWLLPSPRDDPFVCLDTTPFGVDMFVEYVKEVVTWDESWSVWYVGKVHPAGGIIGFSKDRTGDCERLLSIPECKL